MDNILGPNSWLGKLLGMQSGGNAGPFGALGGGGTGPAPAPSGPSINNGMPMSGVGPGAPPPAGAPLNLTPAGPGGNQPGLLGSLMQKFGGGGSGPVTAATGVGGGGGNNNAQAAQLIMSALKPPQLTPAPWMQMMPMGTMRG